MLCQMQQLCLIILLCPQYTAGALVQKQIVDEVAKRFHAALTAIGAENMEKGIVASC